MKFIDKDKVPVPQILTTQGASETKKNKKVYSENKKKYTSNTPTI